MENFVTFVSLPLDASKWVVVIIIYYYKKAFIKIGYCLCFTQHPLKLCCEKLYDFLNSIFIVSIGHKINVMWHWLILNSTSESLQQTPITIFWIRSYLVRFNLLLINNKIISCVGLLKVPLYSIIFFSNFESKADFIF